MISAFGHAGFDQRVRAFRSAAQRRFVASMIAFRPAALSLRFLRASALDGAAPACSLDAPIFSVGRPRFWREPRQTSGVSWRGLPAVGGGRVQHLAKFRNLSVESFLLFLEASDRGSDDVASEFCSHAS